MSDAFRSMPFFDFPVFRFSASYAFAFSVYCIGYTFSSCFWHLRYRLKSTNLYKALHRRVLKICSNAFLKITSSLWDGLLFHWTVPSILKIRWKKLLSHWSIPAFLNLRWFSYFFIGPYLHFLNLCGSFTFPLECTFLSVSIV